MSRLFSFMVANFYHHFYHFKVARMCPLLPSIQVEILAAKTANTLKP